jgi:spermidine synthase
MTNTRLKFLLLASVFAIATCGLVYELIAGTLASYLLGDSVTQFSTIIGVYLFAMGVGSYLSKFVQRNEIAMFIQVELLVGLVGGCSAGLLFFLFAQVSSFRVLLYSVVFIVGVLVGLEIPLLLRILKSRVEFKELVSQVFTFDYVGALIASLLFPLGAGAALGTGTLQLPVRGPERAGSSCHIAPAARKRLGTHAANYRFAGPCCSGDRLCLLRPPHGLV